MYFKLDHYIETSNGYLNYTLLVNFVGFGFKGSWIFYFEQIIYSKPRYCDHINVLITGD